MMEECENLVYEQTDRPTKILFSSPTIDSSSDSINITL